jgi:hypothetical protein
MYGIEFYTTPKGQHRAKIGIAEEVGDGDDKQTKVTTVVLVSESYDKLGDCATAIGETAAALMPGGGAVVIGGPKGFTLPTAEDPEADVPAEADPPAEDLLHYPGRDGHEAPIDRRQLSVVLGLDKRLDNFLDRRVRGILRMLVGDALRAPVTFPEAVAQVNKLASGSGLIELGVAEAWHLAQREIHRLALHHALVTNRDMAPTQPPAAPAKG